MATAPLTPDDFAPRHDVPVGGRSGFTVIDGRQVHYLEWGAVRAPSVLCLHGGGQTAEIIPDSRLRTVANAGHLAAGDNPESTVGLIKAFLDEIAW